MPESYKKESWTLLVRQVCRFRKYHFHWPKDVLSWAVKVDASMSAKCGKTETWDSDLAVSEKSGNSSSQFHRPKDMPLGMV